MRHKRTSQGVGKRINKRNPLLPYGVAILCVALALGMTLLFSSWLYPTIMPLFFVAVMVNAWLGGLGPGLLATLLSTLALNYFFIDPLYSLHIANLATVVRLSMFLTVAMLINWLNQSWRSALENARANLQALQEKTEQEKVAWEHAQRTKERLETVLSSIHDGFYVLDRDWRFTYVNDRYCDMVGMQRSVLLGQNVWELFPAVVGTDADEQFHRAISEQTSLQFDYLYSPWNRWYDHRIYPSPNGLTVFLADITDRKQAELMLVEQKRLLELIASGQPRDDCLSALCGSLSRLNPGTRACFLLTDAQRRTFPRSITPDLPPSFGEGLKDAPINDLCIGTCGEAAYRGQPITCADIANDDRWSQEWRDLCLAHGILACHSKPVMGINNLPLGSLMLCFNEARMPTNWEYQLAEFGTQVASIVFEREQSIIALRESEERLSLAIEGADMVTWDADLQTGKTIWSANHFRILGYDPAANEEATVEMWHHVHPDDLAGVMQAWQQAEQERSLYSPEYRIIRADNGRVVWLAATGRFFYDQAGRAVKFVGVLFDITDRKQAEAALQQREAELRLVTNSVPALISFVNSNQRYRFNNQGYEKWFGLQATDIYGKHIREVLGETAYEEIRPYVEQVLAGQEVTFESQVSYKDGGTRYVNATYVPRFNSQGKVEGFVALVNDISDRKQAEATLRESEERFRHLADVAPVLIWMSGTDKLRNYFNLPWLNFTGRTMEQERGNGWAQGVHPDDFQRCLDTYVTAFDARQPLQMEYRLRRFDGLYRWVIDEAVPRYTSEGLFLGYIGSCIDIEERKQTEESLRQSESRLRLIIESAKDYAIFTLDLNGIIASWNSGAERLLGYVETEAIGCSGRMIFTSEDNEHRRAETEMQTALMQGRAENERWHVRKDGSRFWASGLMMPLLNEGGNPQGLVKILQDKTAQRLASERLQLLYETTRDLLSTDQPLTLMHTLFGKLSLQLDLHSYYNFMVDEKDSRPMLHLRNYGGISDEAAQSIKWIEFGQYICGLVAQERRPIIFDRAQITTHPNAQIICSMGSTAYAGYPLMAQGRLLGTLSFASLTRTYFTPEEIDLLQSTCNQVAIALERANLITSIQQQAEQLQQANRIKDEFLAVLSHELRSPLNPILGWSKLLQTGNLDETQTAQALSVIERNAKLQSELIEDLLDVSRILRGKLSLNVSPVNLVPVIQAALETVRLAAQAKSIQIQARLDSNVGEVSGDSNRLQQVIWNLLSNAVKFTPKEGQVDIRLDRLGSVAQISVSDTGKGIHPDFIPHVFDYFRQEDSATTRKFGGLGLGLAIVRHLVELHGGTIWAESPGEGQGATFRVKLPLMPTPPQTNLDSSQPSELPLNLQGIKVLVVDDEADTREFISFLLEMYGANVTSVASAVEALAALAQYRADVLVSDIGMPEMDGYMLMRQVKALPPEQGGQMPAIALTAYAGEIDYQQAMLAGFQKHVPKPVEPAKLVEAIASLVGQRGS